MRDLSDLKNIVREQRNHQDQSFAAFDFDNTCIEHDIGELVLAHICRNKLLKDTSLILDQNAEKYHELVFRRYHELIGQGDIRSAYLFCTQALSGFTQEEIETIVLSVMKTEGTGVRPVIRELIEWLGKERIDIWVISASAEAIVRPTMQYLNILGNCIGLKNIKENNHFTKEIAEPWSIGGGKVSCIQLFIKKDQPPVLGVGDSINDFPMLEYSLIRAVIDRNNELSKEAKRNSWFIL